LPLTHVLLAVAILVVHCNITLWCDGVFLDVWLVVA